MSLLTDNPNTVRTTDDFAAAREELAAVLFSGIFHRAPNLAQLLTYICEKYFEGAAEHIKEYNIAVEALGRPADFDQKRDSIVRVEAHKLRKRLREYYLAEGASHAVRIEVPSGQYAPRFVLQQTSDESSEAKTPHAPPRLSKQVLLRTGVVLTLVLVLAAILFRTLSAGRGNAAASVRESIAAQPAGEDVRILAGVTDGSTYLDGFGHLWQSDRFFQGGTVFHTTSLPILGTKDPRIYQNHRQGAFSYNIPLKHGVYELRLHFAETLYGDGNAAGGGETTRLFRVFLNGLEILHDFDVIADASAANTADVRVFKDVSPAADGLLHLRFEPGNNLPILSAIEITPGVAGGMLPVRIIAQDHAYTDKAGRYWSPDRFARGGQLVLRNEDVVNADDPEFYRGERYGNISYVIPVVPGTYRATFYFSEMWFGPGQPGAGGVGYRLFDILCNGVALRRNFDIFKEAGGSRRTVTWTAHNLAPNHQGKLVLSLVPVANYASLNALEIVSEPK